LTHNDVADFAACPVNDYNEWNIYKYTIPEQQKCIYVYFTGNCQAPPVPQQTASSRPYIFKPSTFPATRASPLDYKSPSQASSSPVSPVAIVIGLPTPVPAPCPCKECHHHDHACHKTCYGKPSRPKHAPERTQSTSVKPTPSPARCDDCKIWVCL
jgi:hypothetical protein